ncbi:hypothetical protein [Streptomyces meridianus]|uniref:Uncharacterized protein n=1 Tax=Streptomyces meridianus TaxID=2938945 RepID=A0ABT0XBQ3_9ACTN|nr:hypothetical protein [Streptomyces meridianus]MCM2579854.1 hypothetical protein [Streptomyces meridianus]
MALAVLAVLGIGGIALARTVFEDSLPSVAGGQSEQLLGYEEIEALLKDRTRALKSGDEDAYLAPFEGKAKETQRKVFRNLRKVPFAKAEYTVLEQTGTGNDDYGDGASVALDVAFVHKIENVDVRPVAEWYRWIVKRGSADEEPRITRVGGSPSAYGEKGFVYYPAPWDVYDDMYVKRQANTITVADAKNAAAASRFAPHIERGARDDLALWKAKGPSRGEIPRGFLVVLEPNRKIYANLYTSSSEDVGWDAGMSVAMPTFDTENTGKERLQFGGARIKMDTSTSRFTSSQWGRGAKEISRHEIAHAMLQPMDRGEYTLFSGEDKGVRGWVAEGFADYVAFRFDPRRASWRVDGSLKGKGFDGKLPGETFGEYPHTVSMDYALSYLALRFIAEKGGEQAAFRFVVEHYRNPKQLDAQLRTAVGMGTSEFRTAWADYVRRMAR